MGEFLATVWEAIGNLFVAFLQSKVFFVIKFFLMIYTVVLIVDVILLMYFGDVRKQLRQLRRGAASVKTTKRSDWREWNAIVHRLEGDDERQFKAAILEADQFVYKAMDLQGYAGATFAERLAQIPPGSFDTLEVVRSVHALSVKIIRDDKLSITKEQAKNALDAYEAFLKDIDVL